jgi:predicted secreted protein
MAEISGKQAKVLYSTAAVTVLDSWDLTADTNMLDVTTFSTGTVQWRDFTDGLSGWTGTVSGNFDIASTGLTDMRVNSLTPSTAQIELYMDKVGGESLKGSCFISSMGHTAPIDGKVEVSFSVQGTGALTFDTST